MGGGGGVLKCKKKKEKILPNHLGVFTRGSHVKHFIKINAFKVLKNQGT